MARGVGFSDGSIRRAGLSVEEEEVAVLDAPLRQRPEQAILAMLLLEFLAAPLAILQGQRRCAHARWPRHVIIYFQIN